MEVAFADEALSFDVEAEEDAILAVVRRDRHFLQLTPHLAHKFAQLAITETGSDVT